MLYMTILSIDHDGLPRPVDILDSLATDTDTFSAFSDIGCYEAQCPKEED